MDTIGQLVLALDRDSVARQLVEVTGCSLKDFYSHHISVKNWLNDVVKLFATARCTNEQNVAYTTSKLTGEAKCWWQDKKAVNPGVKIRVL